MGLGSVLIYTLIAITILFFLSFHSPTTNHHSSHRHRRLKLRSNFTLSPLSHHKHHQPVPFDPLVADLERHREDKQWEQQHIHHSHPELVVDSSSHAPAHESQPEWEDFMNAEDFINDEDKFNVTNRLLVLFPKIDVHPFDGFVSLNELTTWNLDQSKREVLHRTQREMDLHDKNHDGFLSFSEYDPPTWVKTAGLPFSLSSISHSRVRLTPKQTVLHMTALTRQESCIVILVEYCEQFSNQIGYNWSCLVQSLSA